LWSLRRALDSGNVTIALAAPAELDFVSRPDALELVLLLVEDPGRFRRHGPTLRPKRTESRSA
jgi:hypothetical protein